MRPSILWALVVMAAGGCTFGTRPSHFRPAQQPQGVEIVMDLESGAHLTAEVLSVRDSALVVSAPDGVTMVRLRDIVRGSLPDLRLVIGRHAPPNVLTLKRIRLNSRFPQGLTDDQLQRLLEAYGQPSIRIAGP